MHTDAIRSLLGRRPFIPFELRLADGRAFPVRHPDMLVIAPGGTTVTTFVNFETPTVIPLDQVTSLGSSAPRPERGGKPY